MDDDGGAVVMCETESGTRYHSHKCMSLSYNPLAIQDIWYGEHPPTYRSRCHQIPQDLHRNGCWYPCGEPRNKTQTTKYVSCIENEERAPL